MRTVKKETFTAIILVHADGRPYLRDLKSGGILKLGRIWKKDEKVKIVVTEKK
jgi:hypothetical protein